MTVGRRAIGHGITASAGVSAAGIAGRGTVNIRWMRQWWWAVRFMRGNRVRWPVVVKTARVHNFHPKCSACPCALVVF